MTTEPRLTSLEIDDSDLANRESQRESQAVSYCFVSAEFPRPKRRGLDPGTVRGELAQHRRGPVFQTWLRCPGRGLTPRRGRIPNCSSGCDRRNEGPALVL